MRAWRLLQELNTAEPTLLHADLHHGNILSKETGYSAIDPKGIFGARGYEVGSYLLNSITAPPPTLAKLLPRRVAIFNEVTGLDAQKIVAWGFIHAVLSACWSAEDHGGGHERALELSGVLHKRL